MRNKIDGFRNSIAVYDVIATAPNTYTGFGNLPGGVTININNNSFTNDVVSINNGEVSQVINGGCNWYGTADGATVAGKVSNKTVRFTPYLNNGTDMDAATGFQPGANGCASITGFSPSEGEAGKVVVISGEGFTGTTGVAFNGKPAQNVSVTSDTTLIATVPNGAVTGTVSVTNPSGTVISAVNFFVIPPPAADTVMVCPGSNGLIISIGAGNSYQWQVYENGSFVNITDGANYSGVQKDTLRLLNIPTEWNGRSFRCIVDGNAESKTFILKVANYWTGNGSTTDWNNPLNWGCSGQVPDGNTEVIISSGSVILSEPATAKSIWVSPGASFTVQPGVIITINQQ
jgi:hypothetical protein